MEDSYKLKANIGLDCAVAERMHGITIRPRVDDRKEALPGKEETTVQKDLPVSRSNPNDTIAHKETNFE